MKTSNIRIQHYYKTIRFELVVLLVFFGISFSSAAQSTRENPLGEKATVSLLTASPGAEVWAQYGHTAIRVCDLEHHFDLVFNYGLFDFNSSNFLWRFLTGKTDYMVGTCSYMNFLIEYQMGNRAVTEQILNLLPEEKESLWQSLVANIRPENRTYRYNFFFNNCSTKPRDMIVKALSGTVDYRWDGKYTSLRKEVHYFTNLYPWTQFGIDFALGAPADDSASLKTQQFTPELLMESFAKGVILSDTAQPRQLVLETLYPVTIDSSLTEKTTTYPGPVLVLWIIFVIVAVISYFEFKKGKQYQLLNAMIFLVAGLLGKIIAFMVFFSVHPTTEVNYLLLWLQPIHLVYVFCLIFPAFRCKTASIYLSINFPFQVFALAGTLFLPQYFHPAMFPLLLILMLRSALALWSLSKKRSHA